MARSATHMVPDQIEWIEMTVADAAALSLTLGGVYFRYANSRRWYTHSGYGGANSSRYVKLCVRNHAGILLSPRKLLATERMEVFVTSSIRNYIQKNDDCVFKPIVPERLFDWLPPSTERNIP